MSAVIVPQASPSHHALAVVTALVVLLSALIALGFAIQHAVAAGSTSGVRKTIVQVPPSYVHHMVPTHPIGTG